MSGAVPWSPYTVQTMYAFTSRVTTARGRMFDMIVRNVHVLHCIRLMLLDGVGLDGLEGLNGLERLRVHGPTRPKAAPEARRDEHRSGAYSPM
jgi:hypothetical protein